MQTEPERRRPEQSRERGDRDFGVADPREGEEEEQGGPGNLSVQLLGCHRRLQLRPRLQRYGRSLHLSSAGHICYMVHFSFAS